MAGSADNSRGIRALILLRKLAFSYASRMAQDDVTRASLVLGTFARVYNEYRAQFIGEMPEGYRSWFPERVSSRYDGSTIQALRAFTNLVLPGEDRQRLSASMPNAASDVGPYFDAVLGPTLSERDLSIDGLVAETSASRLAAVLHRYIESGIRTGVAEAPERSDPVAFDTAPTTPAPDEGGVPTGTDTTHQLPEVQVPGDPGGWQMPTWGWWAIGLGGVAALGYISYRFVADEGPA